MATKFQRLRPCLRDKATRIGYWEYCTMSERVVNQRWRPLTGSAWYSTHASARIYVSNNISTAMPIFTNFS